MKLAKKATTFFSGVRRKQSGQSREEFVGGRQDGAVELEPVAIRKLRQGAAAAAAPGRAGAPLLGKRRRNMGHSAVYIHEDEDAGPQQAYKRRAMLPEERIAPDSDDDGSSAETRSQNSDDENEIDESVAEDMRKLEESFKGFGQRYKLLNRIGEGTFSTVYKAEQLGEVDGENNVDEYLASDPTLDVPAAKRRKTSTTSSQTTVPRQKRKPQFVALKKIYVTSSPSRIANELELLHILRDSPHICPLLTAFRHLDQVVAVLPYFRHLDFRLYYRDFLIQDMRHYFKALLSALHSVHKAGILHRDIKPTNFLYDHTKRTGVLVDFGLAEKEGTDWQHCLCQEKRERRKERYLNSFAVQNLQSQPNESSVGYPKNDPRPSRRANRAGTRGFRAPEVLFKCTSQTTKIDIWSAGVILLTLLARRFPFFNSTDDVDAMIELSSIFGRRRMKQVAAIHGSIYETNIETVGENGFSLEKIIIWASCRNKDEEVLRVGEAQGVRFLTGLLELDPARRLTAKEALHHEFFTAPVEDDVERAEREAQELAEQEALRRV